MNDDDDPRGARRPENQSGGDSAPTFSLDHNELFGVLAVHNGFISRETLECAKRERETDKTESLQAILVNRGDLTSDEQRSLASMLEHHLRRNDDDPRKSLSSISAHANESKAQAFFPDSDTFQSDEGEGSERFARVASHAGRFGDYVLIEEIARGGMGVVYKARQKQPSRLVALKMIRAGEFAGHEQIQRFYAEADAAGNLDHPGIVPVYEVGEKNGQHFYSMAFVEGDSLFQRVNDDGPLPPKEAAALLTDVAEAIEFAHTAGVIHRDLKPQNVLLDAKGQPRVTDFGLAKQLHSDSNLTASGQVMGTPSYMAPEQAAGRLDEVGPASDVYSLGATLYFLLTGRPPFQAASLVETIGQVIAVEPVAPRRLNPSVPRDLETICLKCLRKEPGRRYSSASELAADLRRWSDNKPIVARPVRTTEKAWLWCKRRPAVASLLVAILVLSVAGTIIAIERQNATHAERLVESLSSAETEQVPAIIREIESYRRWANPQLRERFDKDGDGSTAKLHYALALLAGDDELATYLERQMLTLQPKQLAVVRDALLPYRDQIMANLWGTLEDDEAPPPMRFNAAAALATYDPSNDQRWQPVLPFVARHLVVSLNRNPRDFDSVLRNFQPLRVKLAHPVSLIGREASVSESERDTALNVVFDYAFDDATLLGDVLMDAERRQFDLIFGKLERLVPRGVADLEAELQEQLSEAPSETAKEQLAKRQANAAIALLRVGEYSKVWALLQSSPDPRARSYVIHWSGAQGVDPLVFAEQLDRELDDSIRRALILALGEFNEQQLPIARRAALTNRLREIYEHQSDPGLHSAAEWLLKQWDDNRFIDEFKLRMATREDHIREQTADRNWYITSQGQTMIVLAGDRFFMGSPGSEPDRDDDEVLHHRKISRRFAVASTPVTKEQYRRFQQASEGVFQGNIDQWSKTDDSPQVDVTWYEAAWYCNWLSQQEGLAEDQWCYEPNGAGHYAAGMKAKADYLTRSGYRLPTEAEWEFACRAGTVTSRYYGLSEVLLEKYAWHVTNGKKQAWPVGRLKPNDFGLFDMHGNVYDWCHERYRAYEVADDSAIVDDVIDSEPVQDKVVRAIRGGSFFSIAENVRSATRASDIQPANRNVFLGFRPVRTFP